MTTENNFTGTSETLKDNVAKGMNWMQDTNTKLVEIQKQQMKTATDMFNKVLATSQIDVTNNLNNSISTSSKAISELFQKNIERATELLKTAMKPVTELTKFSDKDIHTTKIK